MHKCVLKHKRKKFNLFFSNFSTNLSKQSNVNLFSSQSLNTNKRAYRLFVFNNYNRNYCKFDYFFKYVYRARRKKLLYKTSYLLKHYKKLKFLLLKFKKRRLKKINRKRYLSKFFY